ncbi:MAG: iron ABC transporter permease [Candidatus Obscuribacterales bacterium]|nr:iron ABC transporter permease [Candidatus Obscuribacterales bacterium]
MLSRTTTVHSVFYTNRNMLMMRLIILLAILIGITVCSICIGDISISPMQAWQILFNSHADITNNPAVKDILFDIRLPRLLVAFVVGTNLAVSGYVLQNISRNSLADPFLSGVSSGAALFIALGLIFGLDLIFIAPLAFVGGLLASLIAASLARDAIGLSTARLLLAGVGLSAISGAVVTLMLTVNPSLGQSQGILFWLSGSIAGRSYQEFYCVLGSTIVGLSAALLLSKQMRLLSLGPNTAQALGLDVSRVQWALLAIAVLLCATAVCVSGLVGFVGLIAPHMARRLFGNDERLHIICSAMLGASLVLASDLAARTLMGGQELPLGTLLAIVGGPFFLWLIYKQKESSRK